MASAAESLFAAVDHYRKVEAANADTWASSWARRDAIDLIAKAACAMVDDARKPGAELAPSLRPAGAISSTTQGTA